MQTVRHNAIHTAAQEVNALLATARADALRADGRTIGLLENPDERTFLITHGGPNRRRNGDPLLFDPTTTECFCGFRRHHPNVQISRFSSIALVRKWVKAHQCSNRCGPEPVQQHYEDLFELASRLRPHTLTALNLPGSGASGPQHFHTQIYPLQFQSDHGPTANALALLLKNIRVAPVPFLVNDGVELREVYSPMWGWQIRTRAPRTPRALGGWLYHVVHCGLRYASQLQLSYNLYVRWAEEPHTATVLFRETGKQTPFQLDTVRQIVKDVEPSAAAELRTSMNQRWRWGFLECIGGLPTRDGLFADTRVFGPLFWQRVFAATALAPSYRNAVLQQLERLLERKLHVAGLRTSPVDGDRSIFG